MKLLAIDSSGREQGLTARMTAAAADAARRKGAEVEVLYLKDFRLERCRQCDPDGWGQCRREGTCVIEDDFPAIVAKLESCDALVFSTPVYFGDLSESAKALTDRLRRISVSANRKRLLHDLPTVGIAVAGGSGGGTPSCLAAIEKVLSTPGCLLVDLIPVARRNEHYKAETVRIAVEALVER